MTNHNPQPTTASPSVMGGFRPECRSFLTLIDLFPDRPLHAEVDLVAPADTRTLMQGRKSPAFGSFLGGFTQALQVGLERPISQQSALSQLADRLTHQKFVSSSLYELQHLGLVLAFRPPPPRNGGNTASRRPRETLGQYGSRCARRMHAGTCKSSLQRVPAYRYEPSTPAALAIPWGMPNARLKCPPRAWS